MAYEFVEEMFVILFGWCAHRVFGLFAIYIDLGIDIVIVTVCASGCGEGRETRERRASSKGCAGYIYFSCVMLQY